MQLLAALALSLSLARPAPVGAEVRWQKPLPGRPFAACATDGDVVIVGVTHVEGRRALGAWVALDAHTGALRWHTRTRGVGVAERPVLAGDVVIVGNVSFGHTMALDKKTGAVRWRLEGVAGQAADWMSGAPVIDGDTAWLSYVGGVAAVDVATGTRKLTVPFFAGVSVLGVDATRVFVSDMPGNAIIALDKASGAELWRVHGPVIDKARNVSAGFQPSRVVLDARALYVPTNVAETWALDVGTGAKLWGFEPEGGGSFGTARDGAYLLLASTNDALGPARQGFVQRVSAADGQASWTRRLGAPSYFVPVVDAHVPGVVLVTTANGLEGYGLGDGESRVDVALGETVGEACVAPDGTVYVAHQPRKLTALRLTAVRAAP